MYIYILCNGSYYKTPYVTIDLDNGVPSVGTYKEWHVDPSQWFKALVVGSILVDCDHRVVSWTCEEVCRFRNTKDLLDYFENQEQLVAGHQDLDPDINELFLTARNIFFKLQPNEIQTNQSEPNEKPTNQSESNEKPTNQSESIEKQIHQSEPNEKQTNQSVPNEKSTSQSESSEKQSNKSDEIIKLLQLYIVPKIKFQQEHMHELNKTYDKTEKAINNIDKTIESNVKLKENPQENLVRLRYEFFKAQDLENILKAEGIDEHFLQSLLKHTSDDIRKLEKMLHYSSNTNHVSDTPPTPALDPPIEPSTSAVDPPTPAVDPPTPAVEPPTPAVICPTPAVDPPTPAANTPTPAVGISTPAVGPPTPTMDPPTPAVDPPTPAVDNEDMETINLTTELEMKKAVRDEIMQAIKTIKDKQQANPSCFEFVSRKVTLISKDCHDRMLQYIEGTNDLEGITRTINLQMDIKVRLETMRQGIMLTCSEIERNGVSCGQNSGKRWMKKSDYDHIMTVQQVDWLTLRDKVRICLELNKSSLKTKHERFKDMMKVKCEEYVERHKAYSPLDSDKQDATSNLSGQSQTRFRSECEQMCQEMIKHTKKMADILKTEIADTVDFGNDLHQNVYICYEEHLSEEVIPNLTEAFEQIFHKTSLNLRSWIKQYSNTELEYIGITIKKLFPNFEFKKAVHSMICANRIRRSELTRSGLEDLILKAKQAEIQEETLDGECTSMQAKSKGQPLDEQCTLMQPENYEEPLDKYCTSSKTGFQGEIKPASSACKEKTTEISFKILETFGQFFTMMGIESKTLSIFGKLRTITSALNFAADTASKIYLKKDPNFVLGADDFLDICVLLLCEMDTNDFQKLYAHIDMVSHLLPQFLQGGMQENSLFTMLGTFQHLFERKDLHDSGTFSHSVTDNSTI